jgi:hypothetical protein
VPDPPFVHVCYAEPELRHLPQILNLLLLPIGWLQTFTHRHWTAPVQNVGSVPESAVVGGCMQRVELDYLREWGLLFPFFCGQHKSARGLTVIFLICLKLQLET